MFDNIGRKIKTLAKVSCWMGIIGSIIVAIVMINNYYIETRISGWIVLFAGPLVSWISSFTLYALGEIAENSVEQTNLIRNLAKRQKDVCKVDRISTVTEQSSDNEIEQDTKEMFEESVYDNDMVRLVSACDIHGARISSSLSKGRIKYFKRNYFDSEFPAVEYAVHRADFSRARALLAEEFKDDPEVLNSLSPESAADN